MPVHTFSLAADRATLTASGELDIAEVEPARLLLLAHLAAGRRRLSVDLRAVTFLDATFLGAIVGVRNLCREQDGDLTLVGARGLARRVLDLTNLLGPTTVALSPVCAATP